MKVKNRYDEVFQVELEGWCYGLTHFPGEIRSALVHRVVQEMTPLFLGAVQYHYIFDILAVSERLSAAAKYLVSDQEIAFSVLCQLPNPSLLAEEEQFVMAQIIDKAEQKWGGVLDRLQKKWEWEQEKARELIQKRPAADLEKKAA